MSIGGTRYAESAKAAPAISDQRRMVLNRRAKNLATGLVFYNLAEATLSLIAGIVAGSTALMAFGLDSTVEVLSGLVIIWQFRQANPERHEKRALRLIAVAFFALAVYVGIESALTLIEGRPPSPSMLGIAVAVASILIMPFVSWIQRRTGLELGSASVVADSKQVLLCTVMSAALLVGLAGNALMGWWWLDPVVGIVIALLAVHEGLEAMEEAGEKDEG